MTPAGWRRVQGASGRALAVLVVALLANSLFLVTAPATELAALMVQAHLGLGVALCVVLPAFVASHVALHRGHPNERARRVGRGVAVLAGIGVVTGAALWAVGKSSEVRWLVLLHAGAFAVGVVAYGVHRLRATATPALGPERLAAGVAVAGVAAMWALQLVGGAAVEAGGSAFEPGLSRAGTTTGHVLAPADLTDSEYCAQCHEAIAERWESSAHRFGSLNDPFYAATLEAAQRHRDPGQLAFCGGCHDPALLLTGRMTEHPTPDSADADVGITCLVCHSVAEAPGLLGNGSYVLQPPDHYPYYGSEDPDEQEQNRRLIRSKPGQHVAGFGRAHLRTSGLCVSCHKAHIDPELNGHRWLRGQNDYDAWFNSGAGGQSARTFHPPKDIPQRCQDCHMPRIEADDPGAKNGTVADHAFPGSNTALPAVLGDAEWAARSAEFLKDVITVDVGAVQGSGRVLAPGGAVVATAGESLTVDVVVRNVGAGHLFPGGVADLREAWLEAVLVVDGEAALGTGWVDADGHLDPGAYRWNAVLLDGEGTELRRHEVEDAWVVLSSRRIQLGASDVVQVRFPAPDRPARLVLRVMHRKFARDFVQFALGDDAPRMPAHALATTELALSPGEWSAESGADAGPRLRALAIGHLLKGDTRSAREAAQAAADELAGDPGPPLDLARIALADGELEAAERWLRAADGIAPGHPTAAWLLGRVRSSQGQHEAAVGAYTVALAAFPRDRQLLVLRGEALSRLGRDAEAVADLTAALAIDPELLGAHALLAGLTTGEAQTEHQRMQERLRPLSADRSVVERARRAEPRLDRRAQAQWVVDLVAPAPGWASADRARE